MSQEDVRKLLSDMGGSGTTSEIATHAKKKYPDRTLHTYVGQLLTRLETKGFVTRENDGWYLTERGKTTSIEGTPIEDIDIAVTEDDLDDAGHNVVNIVATIELNRELDLYTLSDHLSNSEYNPESSPFLIFRPEDLDSVTLLVPTNGMISVVGAKNKRDVINGVRDFLNKLRQLDLETEVSPSEAAVQNTVLKGDFGVELNLSAVAVGLGFEKTEYEPEQFPGLIYRTDDGSTALIFRTGKYLVNGSKSYAQALETANSVKSDLRELGLEL